MANLILRAVFTAWIAFCALLAYALYRFDIEPFVSIVALIAILAGLLSAFVRGAFFLLFGVVLLLVPWMGQGALLCILATMLIGMISRLNGISLLKLFSHEKATSNQLTINLSSAFYALCLFQGFAIFVSAVPSFYADLDRVIINSIVQTSGIFGLREYFKHDHSAGVQALFQLIQYSIFVGIILVFREAYESKDQKPLLVGFAISIILSCFFGLAQLLALHPILDLARGPLWQLAGRYSATFTDPNALGIASFFLIPFMIAAAYHLPGRSYLRASCLLSAVMLLNISTWSGSRTLLLGLGLWLLIFIGNLLIHKYGNRGKQALALLVVLILFSAAILGRPNDKRSIDLEESTTSLGRVVQSMSWDTAADMFYSRIIFSRLAIEVWIQEPLKGVGVGKFREQLPQVAESLEIPLGTWRDNANNFYLQVLAEQGILGLLITLTFILGAVQCIRYARDTEMAGKSSWLASVSAISLGIFLILLWTGPHIEFTEIIALVAMSVGLALAYRKQIVAEQSEEQVFPPVLSRPITTICATAMVGLLIMQWSARVPPLTNGLYALEQQDDYFFRWTAKRARFVICPKSATRQELQYKALHPDISQQAVRVDLKIIDREGILLEESRTISNHQAQAIILPQVERPILVSLEVSRAWSPLALALSSDPRAFGVQINWDQAWVCR